MGHKNKQIFSLALNVRFGPTDVSIDTLKFKRSCLIWKKRRDVLFAQLAPAFYDNALLISMATATATAAKYGYAYIL